MADFFAKNVIRIVSGVIIVGAVTVLANGMVPVASKHKDPVCTISPSPAALNQSFTIAVTNLPTGGTVSLIITFPSGTTETSAIPVSSGTYSLTESSANSIPAGQSGTYSYRFVAKVKWPDGTFNQSYATCSVNVT